MTEHEIANWRMCLLRARIGSAVAAVRVRITLDAHAEK